MTDELRSKFDLLPCPFCGNTESDFEGSPWPRNREMTSWIVRCGNPSCNAEVIDESPEMVVSRWNRRASRDAEVEALKAEIEGLWKYAERYLQLRDKSLGQYIHPICVSQEQTEFGMRYIGPLVGSALDQALDCAITNKRKGFSFKSLPNNLPKKK